MQEEVRDPRSEREAELVEVLSSYVEPRAVSYRFVAGFVVVGLVGCVSVAWAASRATIHLPIRFEPEAAKSLAQGIHAFERGDWDESERLLLAARASGQVAPQRLDDYLERLELLRRDSDILLRAEEALELGEPGRALALTALVASNSAFFAHAEVLSRAARVRVEEMATKQVEARGAAREQNSAAPTGVEALGGKAPARTDTPASADDPPKKAGHKGVRTPAIGGGERGKHPNW